MVIRAVPGFLPVMMPLALTVATAVLLLDHDTDLSVALEGETVSVDLLHADLYTGSCCIWKQGAAPSYVRLGEQLKCAVSSSLPSGFSGVEGTHPDAHSFTGKAGPFAVLVSDGVLCGRGDSWLRSLLADASGGDPRQLAEAVLQISRRETGGEDDGTVLVLSLTESAV